jgi:hypothetical protein
VWLDPVARGLVAAALGVLLHVEHREALAADLLLIPPLEHLVDDLGLLHVRLVVEAEEGGERRSAAAEVPLLRNHVQEATLANRIDALCHVKSTGADQEVGTRVGRHGPQHAPEAHAEKSSADQVADHHVTQFRSREPRGGGAHGASAPGRTPQEGLTPGSCARARA